MNYEPHIQNVEKILGNLSQVLDVSFAISDSRGSITNRDCHEGNDHRDVYKKLFAMIAASKKPQMTKGLSGETIWGLPIFLGAEAPISLVIIHGSPAGVAPFVRGHGSTTTGGKIEETAEGPIIALVEEVLKLASDRCAGEKELDSFAEELSLRYEELNCMYRVAERIGQVEDVPGSLNYILRSSMELVNADLAFIHVPQKGVFDILCSKQGESPAELLDSQAAKNVTSELLQMFQTKPDYLSHSDLKDHSSIASSLNGHERVLIVPVCFQEKAEGVLLFGRPLSSRDFAIGDKRLITIVADMVSSMITNAELFADLKDFLMTLIKSFVRTIEEKDTYTRGHSERVNKRALEIGKALGLDETEMETLNFASLLHDIGKIGIPEKILNKSSALTEDEFEKIKQHPLKGCKILEPIKHLGSCLPGILYHHERIDGRGYPEGMPGHQIPLTAKIIAVADIYDAMTSDRAYRKAMTSEGAIQEMLRVSGKQVDTHITQTFLSKCLDAHFT